MAKLNLFIGMDVGERMALGGPRCAFDVQVVRVTWPRSREQLARKSRRRRWPNVILLRVGRRHFPDVEICGGWHLRGIRFENIKNHGTFHNLREIGISDERST